MAVRKVVQKAAWWDETRVVWLVDSMACSRAVQMVVSMVGPTAELRVE